MPDTYYNEFDPKTAAWLRQLAADGRVSAGVVDERSITDVRGDDLRGFRRVHLFAGIGGWDQALRLAGWPDDEPVWTGSCPCQPFSSAGKRKGHADERHLWPEMFRLIRECRPPIIFGEQVASSEVVGTELEAAFVDAVQAGDFARANKLAKRLVAHSDFHFHPRWLDGIHADLEAEGYSFRFKVLGAHSVGAPHIRQRVFWVADARHEHEGAGISRVEGPSRVGRDRPAIDGDARGRAPAREPGLQGHAGHGDRGDEPGRLGALAHGSTAEAGGAGWVGESDGSGRTAISSRRLCDKEHHTEPRRFVGDPWSDFDIVWCRDPRGGPDIPRRIEPGTFPLAHGVPARVVRLRGYGNAIVPQAAAEFVRLCRGGQ